MRIFLEILKTWAKLLLGKGTYTSYAQFGEDLIMRPFLPVRGGTYVDVGCYHPTLYSNTYRLYTLGWSGIVIDPNPTWETLFKVFRPRDTYIHAAIGTGEKGKYHLFTDGAYNTFDEALVEKYKKRTTYIKNVEVPFISLNEACRGLTKIDVLSVDVEGLDYEVLSSYDWKIRPHVVIVETAPQSEAADFLIGRNYAVVGVTKLNTIFLDQESHEN